MILSSAVGAEDTALLTDTIRAAVGKADPAAGRSERVHRDGPVDHDLWAVLGAEIGVGALAVPEAAGGLGTSFAAVAASLELLGSELTRVPVLSGVVAAAALARCADHPRSAELLAGLAAGDTVVATVLADCGDDPRREGIFRAERVGSDVFVTGRADFVLDGSIADAVLVHASDEHGGLGLYVLNPDDLTVTGMETTDPTRVLSRIVADAASAVLLTHNPAPDLLRDHALVALACDSLGVARACLETAVDHAKNRVQFGRVIGGFQAVKHMLAEVAVAVELADSAVAHAVWAVEEGSDHDLAEAAVIAALTCNDAADRATATNVQVHGGIGFTWEHSAHLYYRRALASSVLWGNADDHAQRLYVLATGAERTDGAIPTSETLREPAPALFATEP